MAAGGTAAIFFVGVTGSMAALTTMLFPSGSLSEGLQMDFDPNSHPLLRLRILHPIVAVGVGVGLLFIASWVKANTTSSRVKTSSNVLSILVLVQLAFGAATLLTLGPIAMQLGHLLLADLVWITFVLMFANQFTASDLN
jgi:heme A synthase